MIPALLPEPQHSETRDGELVLSSIVTTRTTPLADAAAQLLSERLWAGAKITVIPAQDNQPTVVFVENPELSNEGYTLEVSPTDVRIEASSAAGFVYATHTLVQLMGAQVWRAATSVPTVIKIPAIAITDAPKFALRGIMLDVARHFLPPREVLRFIDLMAQHKFNRLHFHLTDDQGWRVEIKKWPRLTEVGSWRHRSQVGADDAVAPVDNRPHGGYYTQEQLRDIVAYAADRGIVVVPEVDIPGHSQAAIAAYPELGVPEADGSPARTEVGARWGVPPYPLNAEQSTVDFYKDVFTELMDIFPSPEIVLGGDEVPAVRWQEDPRSRALADERGLADPGDLQFWFLEQLKAHLEDSGRSAVVWDEYLEHSSAADVTVLGWRGIRGIAVAANREIPVIACPDDYAYFDYRQSELEGEPIPVGVVLDLERVYSFDPIVAGVKPGNERWVRGGQANLWSEHLDSPRSVDYMAWPRACALSEVLWSGPGREFTEFKHRLAQHLKRLDNQGVEYRKESGPEPWRARPGVGHRKQSLADRASQVNELLESINGS